MVTVLAVGAVKVRPPSPAIRVSAPPPATTVGLATAGLMTIPVVPAGTVVASPEERMVVVAAVPALLMAVAMAEARAVATVSLV
jgi:hypothetical protein